MEEFEFNICAACGSQYVPESDHQSLCLKCEDLFEKIKDDWTEQHKKFKLCCKCGRPFEIEFKKQRKCLQPHFKQCECCGRSFQVDLNKPDNKNCSIECSRLSRKRKADHTIKTKYGVTNVMQLKSVQDKVKSTNLERYGVQYPMQSEEFQQKIKETNIERYGVEWAQQSQEIRKKSKVTNLERYGVENVSQSEEIKQKSKETNLKKYGVEHATQSQDVKDKITSTNVSRYGGTSSMHSEEIKEKARKTNVERYGVEYPIQADEVKNKRKQTVLSKYGVEEVFQSEDVQTKISSTNLHKYGSENPMHSEIGHQRYLEALRKKYGVDNISQLEEIAHKIQSSHILRHADQITDEQARENYLKFKNDPVGYIQHLNGDITIRELAISLGYSNSDRIYQVCHENPELLAYLAECKHNLEHEIYKFLSEDLGCNVIMHDRKHIAPYEIDMWLPDHQIGIEINDTYTHNSSLPNHWDNSIKPADYHKAKTDLAQTSGIRLIHIFEYNWINRQDIVKSIIRNAVGCTRERYFARKLAIKEVDSTACERFLGANHIQGSMISAIRLGLFNNDDLVSLMTFNKTRHTIGRRNQDEDVWELGRFCSSLNTQVVGGASKLFKYFISTYQPRKVISFSSRSYTTGRIYERLGFHLVSVSDPGYMWVNMNTNLALNRVDCQKHNLPKLFKDDGIDLNKTEQQIMVEHGFVQVFDSGVERWEWTQ